MDALQLLTNDHRKVKELFKQAEADGGGDKQKQIFQQIKSELETHARIEESIFYPAVAKHEELKDLVRESIEEHNQVKSLLKEMEGLSSGSETFKPKLKVLMENVEHHAEEEEEGHMFPKVRQIFSSSDLESLGKQLESAKGQR